MLSANPWRAATLGLLALLIISIVIAAVGGGGDAKAKPKTLAVSLEKKFSGQLERVEQELRPVMSEQGAEGTAYRVEEGSTSCREQDRSPSYLCLVWLVDGEGARFSLAYSLTSTDGGCWKATPERAQLADGRPIVIDPAKLPPLDYCLSSSAEEDEATACDPSYPDFCIPSPPPDRNCADLSHTDFTVKTEEGDPHGFDSDGDGVGCEEPTPEPPEAPTEPKGPAGVLGTSSVGPVRVGMPSEQVEALFGPPERKEEVNFGGDESAPQIDWIWDFDDGEFRLQFETENGTVTGYVSDAAELSTKSGVSVGDSFDLIRDQYGDQLEESPVGEGAYLLSEGEPGTHPALTFSVEGDTISSISGGELQPEKGDGRRRALARLDHPRSLRLLDLRSHRLVHRSRRL